MPQAATSILIGDGEPIAWKMSIATHGACGKTFLLATTHDESVAISGASIDDIERFASTLWAAVGDYRVSPEKAEQING